MTKAEKKIFNAAVRSIIKKGCLVENTKLPKKLRYDKKLRASTMVYKASDVLGELRKLADKFQKLEKAPK